MVKSHQSNYICRSLFIYIPSFSQFLLTPFPPSPSSLSCSHSFNHFYYSFNTKRNRTRMCNNMAWSPSHRIPASSKRRHRSKQTKAQIYRLSRKRCEENVEKDMELMNLKLYLENQSIIEENDKLRKKASLLHQENLVLMSEFQKKFPHLDRFSTTLLLLLHKH